MARVSAGEWEKRVERWSRSGEAAADFGARAGIDPKQLHWWKWKLGKVGRAAAESRPAFVRVRVMESKPKASASHLLDADEETSAIEITLATGVRIRVAGGFEPGALREVLCALRDASC